MADKKEQKSKEIKKEEKTKEEKKDLTQVEHVFVPIHERLDEEETEQLLNNYGIKKQNLPKINLNDPAIKKSEVMRGDVIKITRKSPTAGTTLYYRVVI